MAKIVLPDIGSLANQLSAQSSLNSNFTAIENAWENNLSRDGTSPNQMEADLDLNSNSLLNVADPVAETDGVNLRSVRPLVNQFASEIAETIIEGTLRVDVFTASAAQTQFTLTDSPGTVDNVQVSVNGLIKIPGVDYTLSGSDLKTLEFFAGLSASDKVIARYTQLSPADSLLRSDLLSSVATKGAALVKWKHTGTGAVDQTVLQELTKVVRVEHFGAVGDGVTDDTTAVNAAIDAVNAAGGGVVEFGPNQYKVGAIIQKSGVTLRGAGMAATELVQNGTPDYVVKAQGSLAASIAITSNVLIGATTLQLSSTATLAADDLLILSDAFQYNSLDTSYVSGEMVRVLSVDSGVQVTLYAPVKGSMAASGTYTTANTAIVRKITMVDAPGIEELTITGDQTSTTGLLAYKYCSKPNVKNVSLRNGGHYGLRVDTTTDAVVTGLVVFDLLDNIGSGHVGYGIVLAGANDGVIISDCHFTRCRHAITTIGGPDGYSHRIVVSGCTAHGTTEAGFDTHAAGDGIVFHGCQVHGAGGQGFSIRSINTEVANCIVSRCTNHGIAATETLVRNLAVRDCTVEYSDQHGFNASSAVEGLIISGNTFRAPANDGIRIASTSTFVQILDNYIIQPGRTGTNRSGITSIASGATAARWLVARNFIRADSGSVDNAITLPNVNTSYVVDNKAFGTFTTQPFILGANLDLRNDAVDAIFRTPSQITANQNNYAPSGNGSTGDLRISSDAARSITGLTGGVDGRVMTFWNIGAFTITLDHDSASSTAANRFYCPNNTNFAIRQNGSVMMKYDAVSSRWRLLGA